MSIEGLENKVSPFFTLNAICEFGNNQVTGLILGAPYSSGRMLSLSTKTFIIAVQSKAQAMHAV